MSSPAQKMQIWKLMDKEMLRVFPELISPLRCCCVRWQERLARTRGGGASFTYSELHSPANDSFFYDPPHPQDRYVCEARLKEVRPGWGRGLDGAYLRIINTNNFPQKISMEVCRNSGERCSFLPQRLTSTCRQRYSVHKMAAIDPRALHNGIYLAAFKVPSGCFCHISSSSLDRGEDMEHFNPSDSTKTRSASLGVVLNQPLVETPRAESNSPFRENSNSRFTRNQNSEVESFIGVNPVTPQTIPSFTDHHLGQPFGVTASRQWRGSVTPLQLGQQPGAEGSSASNNTITTFQHVTSITIAGPPGTSSVGFPSPFSSQYANTVQNPSGRQATTTTIVPLISATTFLPATTAISPLQDTVSFSRPVKATADIPSDFDRFNEGRNVEPTAGSSSEGQDQLEVMKVGEEVQVSRTGDNNFILSMRHVKTDGSVEPIELVISVDGRLISAATQLASRAVSPKTAQQRRGFDRIDIDFNQLPPNVLKYLENFKNITLDGIKVNANDKVNAAEETGTSVLINTRLRSSDKVTPETTSSPTTSTHQRLKQLSLPNPDTTVPQRLKDDDSGPVRPIFNVGADTSYEVTDRTAFFQTQGHSSTPLDLQFTRTFSGLISGLSSPENPRHFQGASGLLPINTENDPVTREKKDSPTQLSRPLRVLTPPTTESHSQSQVADRHKLFPTSHTLSNNTQRQKKNSQASAFLQSQAAPDNIKTAAGGESQEVWSSFRPNQDKQRYVEWPHVIQNYFIQVPDSFTVNRREDSGQDAIDDQSLSSTEYSFALSASEANLQAKKPSRQVINEDAEGKTDRLSNHRLNPTIPQYSILSPTTLQINTAGKPHTRPSIATPLAILGNLNNKQNVRAKQANAPVLPFQTTANKRHKREVLTVFLNDSREEIQEMKETAEDMTDLSNEDDLHDTNGTILYPVEPDAGIQKRHMDVSKNGLKLSIRVKFNHTKDNDITNEGGSTKHSPNYIFQTKDESNYNYLLYNNTEKLLDNVATASDTEMITVDQLVSSSMFDSSSNLPPPLLPATNGGKNTNILTNIDPHSVKYWQYRAREPLQQYHPVPDWRQQPRRTSNNQFPHSQRQFSARLRPGPPYGKITHIRKLSPSYGGVRVIPSPQKISVQLRWPFAMVRPTRRSLVYFPSNTARRHTRFPSKRENTKLPRTLKEFITAPKPPRGALVPHQRERSRIRW